MIRFAAVAVLSLVTSCAQAPATSSTIDALLGSSLASEAVAYVASLNPKIEVVLSKVNAGIAEYSPEALRVGCGSLNMLTLTLTVASHLPGVSIPSDFVSKASAVNRTLQAGVCAHPPTNLAEAVRIVYEQFAQLRSALRASGATTGT